MPIEFKCPSCRVIIRVPDVYGGKKAHCPKCKVGVRIPASGASHSTAIEKIKDGPRIPTAPSTPATSSDQPAPTLVPAEPAAEAAIPSPLKTPPAVAAVKTVTPIPTAAVAAPEPPQNQTQSGFITFPCPSCNRMAGFPVEMAGAPAVCPACRKRVMVPQKQGDPSFLVGGAVPSPSAAVPAAQFNDAPTNGLSHYGYTVGGAVAAVVIFALAYTWGRGAPKARSDEAAVQPSAPVRVAEAPPPKATESHDTETKAQPQSADEKTTPGKTDAPALTQPAHAAQAAQFTHDNEIAGKPFNDPNEIKAAPTAVAPPAPVAPPPPPPSVDTMIGSKDTKSNGVEDDSDTAPAPIGKTAPPPNKDKDADTGKPAAQDDPAKPAKTDVAAPKAPVQPAKPAPPAPVCPNCGGTGFVPNVPPKAYVRMGSEKVTTATAAAAVPWRFCPKCNAGKDPQTLVAAETARITASADEQKNWEELAGKRLTFAETPHVTLRSTMSETETRIVAAAMEQLTLQLQQATLSTMLTQTRPDTDQILIGGDKPGYKLFLDVLSQLNPKEDFSLAKDATGFMMSHMAVYNAIRDSGMQARNMGLYQLGEMLIQRATDNKAPAWLRLGFASYCENAVTKQNLCYAFQYEKNEVHFGENWDLEIKKYANQSKLKTWDLIFPVQPIGMTALDYLTCYSMVEFLMVNEPKLFPKLCQAFREGLDSEKAIQKVYSMDYKRVQMMWANWAIAK